MYVNDTVVTFRRLCSPHIITGLGNVIQSFPGVRCLVVTDVDNVFFNVVCLVDSQSQAVNAVTSVYCLEQFAVVTGDIQGVGIFDQHIVLVPGMRPEVRCIDICDIHLFVTQSLRIDIESQNNDTVATVVITCQRVAIGTGIFEETRLIHLAQAEA